MSSNSVEPTPTVSDLPGVVPEMESTVHSPDAAYSDLPKAAYSDLPQAVHGSEHTLQGADPVLQKIQENKEILRQRRTRLMEMDRLDAEERN